MAIKRFLKRWFGIKNPFADDPKGDLGTNDLEKRMNAVNRSTAIPIRKVIISPKSESEKRAYELGLKHAQDHGSAYGTETEVIITDGERRV